MSVTINMGWLYNRFGGRYLINCKESGDELYQGMAAPVAPERLIIDKRLDTYTYSRESQIAESGMVDVWRSWGRPLDPSTAMPAPTYLYPAPIQSDGAYGSTPLRVGALARTMLADMMGDVRTLRLKMR